MGRYIITGTGRAGTSFLVQLLTQLGLDTGFRSIHQKWNKKTRSGMETDVDSTLWRLLPTIIKDPKLSTRLRSLHERGFLFAHVYVPIRALEDAATSRRDNQVWWDEPGTGTCPEFLGHVLGQLVADLVLLDIPYTLMAFPRLVQDWAYCRERLGKLVEGIAPEDFRRTFEELSTMVVH